MSDEQKRETLETGLTLTSLCSHLMSRLGDASYYLVRPESLGGIHVDAARAELELAEQHADELMTQHALLLKALHALVAAVGPYASAYVWDDELDAARSAITRAKGEAQ